jgi:hypothetical protein
MLPTAPAYYLCTFRLAAHHEGSRLIFCPPEDVPGFFTADAAEMAACASLG